MDAIEKLRDLDHGLSDSLRLQIADAVAAIKAENERLTLALATMQSDYGAVQVRAVKAERALAERAGGVQAKAWAELRKRMASLPDDRILRKQVLLQMDSILSALTTEPAAQEGAGTETRRGKSREDLHKHGPDLEPDFLAGEQSGETGPGAPEGRQEAVAWYIEWRFKPSSPDVKRAGGGSKVLWDQDASPDKAAAEVARLEGIEAVDWVRCIPLYTRPAEQAVTEAGIERAAKHITKWLGFAWDGLHDGRVTERGFPVFMHHSQTGWKFQGHKGDMIDLARAALSAALAQKEEGR